MTRWWRSVDGSMIWPWEAFPPAPHIIPSSCTLQELKYTDYHLDHTYFDLRIAFGLAS